MSITKSELIPLIQEAFGDDFVITYKPAGSSFCISESHGEPAEAMEMLCEIFGGCITYAGTVSASDDQPPPVS